MKSGVLGIAKGDIGEIEAVVGTVEKQGREMKECVDIHETITDLSGEILAYSGVAAEQYYRDADHVQIEDEGVSVSTRSEVAWRSTNFLAIPDNFLVVENSNGEFLFDVFRDRFGVSVERVEIDLQSFRKHVESQSQDSDVRPWKVGFYGREGEADNGILHGNDILRDKDLGQLLERHPANQLGLTFEREGTEMKVFVAESGYVEVYQPNDLEAGQFIDYLQEDIVPNIRSEFVPAP